jgi:hypothetical protein
MVFELFIIIIVFIKNNKTLREERRTNIKNTGSKIIESKLHPTSK